MLVAIPIFTQFVTRGGIHCRHQLEGIEGFAARIDLLEDHAHRFLGGGAIQGDYGNPVGFEVFQNLALERPEQRSRLFVVRSRPILVEAILPLVPVEYLGDREHEGGVFVGRG
ncbi:hypothetical protein D9M70_429710 [compost metagenome]